MPDELTGFRKINALELDAQRRQELHRALQLELTEALIRKIRENPPEIDLHSVRLVLKPNQKISNWTVASDCGTCATCNTCTTCATCVTHTLPQNLPKAAVKKLKVKQKVPQK
jgi:hypothetical protein